MISSDYKRWLNGRAATSGGSLEFYSKRGGLYHIKDAPNLIPGLFIFCTMNYIILGTKSKTVIRIPYVQHKRLKNR